MFQFNEAGPNLRTKIFLATEPVDFRKGVDGLRAVCKQVLKQDPYSGNLYVFRNKRRTAIKILYWDSQGWWLSMKRLAKGKFLWWPKSEEDVNIVDLRQLQVLLWNGHPEKAEFQEIWRKI